MRIPFLTILALVGSLPLVSGADITGKVVLKGTPPAEVPIDMSASQDKTCGPAHPEPVTTRHYLVNKDGGLANVFVYLKSGVTQKDFPAPAEAPVLDQVGCLYEPYVMGVMVNQKFKIRNSDPTMHNVHALPRQGKNAEFNFAQPTKGQVNEKSFPSPEVMVQHPFFAVTGKDGTFKISGVPNGKYTIEAYHAKTHRGSQGVTQEITVSGDTKVDFTIALK